MVRYRPLVALVTLVVAACRRHEVAAPAAREADAAVTSPSEQGPQAVVAEGESFEVRSWPFETVRSAFAIKDLELRRPLKEALTADATLALNGGFFDVDGRALGLAASGGTILSRFSPTMSGGVFSVTDGVARLDATADFDPKQRVDFAIQCRPRLVVDGHPNVKSNDGHGADRTAMCIRDSGRTVDVILARHLAAGAGPSLFALGHYLADTKHCESALNLDGGPSAGVAYRDASGEPVALAPRGPIRHAVVIREKPLRGGGPGAPHR